MTLSIHVSVRDQQTGQERSIELPLGYHLMGFEIFRQELWGTDVMWDLGLELLPRLGQGINLWLDTPEKITQLEHEAELIRDNIDKVLAALGPYKVEPLKNRYLPNLFNAVSVACSVGGEISIG